MEDAPVTIIVKAPNQQFEDQTIKCEVSWTIKRLKNYLSEVYPNKPKSDEQKLIYSGQLLTDTAVLKDILRQYEGQDTHTVHLVFTPKNAHIDPASKTSTKVASDVGQTEATQSGATSSITTDGLRNRFAETSNPTNQYFVVGDQPAANMTYAMQQQMMLAQQYAMQNTMQQIYMQYLQQYMNSLATNPNSPSPQPAAGSPSTVNSPLTVPFMQQGYPHIINQQQQLLQSPLFQNHLQQLQQQHHQLQQQQHQPANDGQSPAPYQIAAAAPPNAQAAGDAEQPAAVQAPDGAVAPRFPNVVQDEVENHDWLDMFYATSRLMVLVTLVYFYSSPLRCLIVIFFIILYYMYHVGYFRQLQHLAEANNNNPALAAGRPRADAGNVAPANAGENLVPAADAAQQPAVDDANAVQPSSNDETTVQEPANHRTPVIALIRTVILSFFASLIPDTPAL